MTSLLTSQLNKERFTLSLATASKFVGVGILWIVLSDLWLFFTQDVKSDHMPLFHGEVIKGIAFVIAMGIFVFIVVRKQNNAIEINELELFIKNPQAMWVIDFETMRFLDVNEAAITMYGYSKADFLGMTILDIRTEEEIPKAKDALDSVRSGSRYLGQTRHIRKDKSLVHVEIAGYPIMYHRTHAGLILATDITNQVRAEQTLEEARKHFEKKIHESLHELALYNKELQVRIREVNSSNDDLISVNKLLQEANNKVNSQYGAARERYHAQLIRLMANVDHAFWLIDLKNPNETFISDQAAALFNISRDAIVDRPNFWEDRVADADKKNVAQALRELEMKGLTEFDYTLDGTGTRVQQKIYLICDENDRASKIECFVKELKAES